MDAITAPRGRLTWKNTSWHVIPTHGPFPVRSLDARIGAKRANTSLITAENFTREQNQEHWFLEMVEVMLQQECRVDRKQV
jgi:hypothetical protein